MPGQEGLDNQVVGVAGTERAVRCTTRWHATESRLGSRFALPLIVHIEKGLVSYDRAAQRTTELVVVKRVLRSSRVEEVAGATDRTGAVVLEQRSMQLVRAALGHDVHHRAAVPPVLRFVV